MAINDVIMYDVNFWVNF